jgi:hypothetical protein
MAFGFSRQPGNARGYVNENNSEYAIGHRLSRRQYDKYVKSIGQRKHLPGVEAIRETEKLLEKMRSDLAQRSADLDTREEALALRERELELEQQLFRKGRHSAGQRRYNVMLDAYVANERRKGRTLNKRQAMQEPVFKQAMIDMKGKPNKRHDPNIAARNVAMRRKALETVGGNQVFREYYDSMYGASPQSYRRPPGQPARVRARR